MDGRDVGVDARELRARLERIIIEEVGGSSEQAAEFSFHMTDWLDDLEALWESYESIHEVDDEKLYTVVLDVLIHAPAHVVRAATIMTEESAEEMLTF